MADSPVHRYYEKYRQLRAMRDAGQMSPQQFLAEIQMLRWQDSNGVWWQISVEGALLSFDGRQWIPAQPPPAPAGGASAAPGMPPAAPPGARPATPGAPPGIPPAAPPGARPAPPTASAAPPGARPGTPGGSFRLTALAPLLPIIPAVLCGGSWFLYTSLRIEREGTEALDCVTPLIVGGLPVAFWLFKQPLDNLLSPLKPVILSIPWAVRLGIVLAVPIFLGFILNAFIFPEGYLGLNVSTFISVVVAGVLMRYR